MISRWGQRNRRDGVDGDPGVRLLPLKDIVLAVVVAAVYGVAFVAIKFSVLELPPLMVTGWRFLLAAIPMVLFVPRPRMNPWWLVLYGVMQGVVMFGLIFVAIGQGMPGGLASLVVQMQVFFTVLFSAVLFKERPRAHQIAGGLVAIAGVVVIGWSKSQGAPLLPFMLVIASACAWGMANVIAKAAKPTDMLGFIVWSSLAAPLPLFLLSMWLEAAPFAVPAAMPSWTAIGSILFLAYPTTVFAFAAWVTLLRRYPAAVVTPFALLIPVFGISSTALVFGETVPMLVGVGAALVFVGLAVNVFGGRLGWLSQG